MQPLPPLEYWAKTLKDASPGTSVIDHCLNVGCVAEAIVASLHPGAAALLPAGSVTLAALHDIGKISPGFQSKCQQWLIQNNLAERASRERWMDQAESDHAKITQHFLQEVMKLNGCQLWSVAAGVHHGRIHGRRISQLRVIDQCAEWETAGRSNVLERLIEAFGPLPSIPPGKDLVGLWYLSGLISVADWIGSSEAFFPDAPHWTLNDRREAANRALAQIAWGKGSMRSAEFPELFAGFSPNPLQEALHQCCDAPGLFVIEGPMGSGKTEAALWAAHRLIEAGCHQGIYFALPTQVTSNRIHERVSAFLGAALVDAANLRLAHAGSWLRDDQSLVIRPSAQTLDADADAREGRSWFASAKHALLARYGVGTVDQALQAVVAVKHFFVRRFGLAGKVVILDEVHSYDIYTGALITQLIRELLRLQCSVIVLSATLTQARRSELIGAADGIASSPASTAYPLITVARAGSPAVEIPMASGGQQSIHLRSAAFSEEAIIDECVERAEAGQHVLYLRNTVAEAQESFRTLRNAVRAERAVVGCLHSRFPYFRREELEAFWLRRLGKHRQDDGTGSLLVATQVAEQSVDIDLDFIVSDLAPTDMLLQRMGRLWRHQRPNRRAGKREFWIKTPTLDPSADAACLKAAFGKSGLVYAPYVLLRTAEVFRGREKIVLPDQIREVLEATYAPKGAEEEAPAWAELYADIERERVRFAAEAEAATRVLGQPSVADDRELLTRRKGPPTRDLVLIRSCEVVGADRWRVTCLDGESVEVSGWEWSFAAARAFHRNLARVPRYLAPSQIAPRWLSTLMHRDAGWAMVAEGGLCSFPDNETNFTLAYQADNGLEARERNPTSEPVNFEDDDEFDS